jgi:TonB family protein
MNMLSSLNLALGLAVLFSPVSLAENKQEDGEKLIRHAEQVSDIRSADAPAFRLKASFKGLGHDAPTGEGTYIETWVSRGRWRRESTLGDFRRTEVGGETRLWILDTSQESPGKADQLGALMHVGDIRQQAIKIAAIRDQNVQGVKARCVELKRGNVGNETLCIEPQKGVLLLRKTPTRWMNRTCQYGEYENFAGRMYPRHIQCMEDGHAGIDVKVLELAAEPSPDAALFAPLPGAKELANCPGKIQPPRVLDAPDPEYPKGERPPSSPEVLWLIVGADGKPRDVRVARSIGKAFDKPALEAVGKWVFRPATCNGDPVAVQINVEVIMRSLVNFGPPN